MNENKKLEFLSSSPACNRVHKARLQSDGLQDLHVRENGGRKTTCDGYIHSSRAGKSARAIAVVVNWSSVNLSTALSPTRASLNVYSPVRSTA